tara:strand:+ start:357 stop:1106 length:750 start_codon:yes stop_codon:yes gene_type:complete
MTLTRKIRIFLQKFLPNSVMRILAFIYGMLLPAKKSYASAGEDLIIAQYFKDKNIIQGVYIDIGCFHPFWSSNTFKLHKLGWIGYCYDIDQYKLKMMKRFRKSKVKTFYEAIVPKANILKKQNFNYINVYKFLTPWSDLDTCDLVTAENHSKKYKLDYKILNVPANDINTVLNDLPSINFFKIDIEGLDELILMELNFELYLPDVILFENVEIWSGSKEIQKKLEKHGYERLFVSGYSVCYAQPILERI